MKELIERMREAIDNMDDYARMAGVEAVGPLKVLNEGVATLEQQAAELVSLRLERDMRRMAEKSNVKLQKQIEELSAALAVKDKALTAAKYATTPSITLDMITDAIALQPNSALVAKIKADAVLEFASGYADHREYFGETIKDDAQDYADRIEREGK